MLKTQRDAFFDELYKLALKDKDIIVITADWGAPSLDQWWDLSGQYINVGIAENAMITVATGLALSGKRPYCCAIAPFAVLRCYEAIKVNICCMNLPVVIVGVGAGLSYEESGPTHHATEDIAIMRALPNMQIASPANVEMARQLAQIYDKPTYIRLDRQTPTNSPSIIEVYSDSNQRFWPLWLKPFEWSFHPATQLIITVEEHLLAGGLGSIVAEYLADNNIQIPLKRIGLKDKYYYTYGGRKKIWDGEAELSDVIEGVSDYGRI